jgi:hypothetical protein
MCYVLSGRDLCEGPTLVQNSATERSLTGRDIETLTTGRGRGPSMALVPPRKKNHELD